MASCRILYIYIYIYITMYWYVQGAQLIEYLILGYPLMCSNFFYLYSTPVASHVAGSYTTSRRADEGRRPRAEARALTSLQHTQGGDTQSQDGEGVYPKLLRLVLPVAGFLLYIYICLCLEAVSCCRKLHSRLQSQKSQQNRPQRQRCDDRVW